MVSIRYFLEVGELRRTKSMPLGARTSKRGPGGGVWASRLNAQRSRSAPAFLNRAADNSNLTLKFSGPDRAKPVSSPSARVAGQTSVRAKNLQITASRIVAEIEREHVPGRIDGIR